MEFSKKVKKKKKDYTPWQEEFIAVMQDWVNLQKLIYKSQNL